jgi:hypothetical protein
VDADNGSGNPEWLKIEHLTVDEVVIDDPGGTMPTEIAEARLRAVNFMPASGSSSDLIVLVSEDADHNTGGDNDPARSVADGTLVILKWENPLHRAGDLHFIVTHGTLWLKGLEVSYDITFQTGPPPEPPPFGIHDWDFGEAGNSAEHVTWFSTMDKQYTVEVSTDLSDFFPVPGAITIPAQPGYFTTATDPGFPDADRLFIRVVERESADWPAPD